MRWIVLALLFLGMIINFADKSIIGLAAVPIMKEFNLSYSQWGLVGSSYYWLYPVTGIIGAAWADRIGAKKMLGLLMLTWAVLQFGVLGITGFFVLIVYRVLLGAFEGPFSPISYSHAHNWFPPKLRGFANSVVVSGATVGAMVVAPLLVALITILGWRWAFAILGAASLVWFVLIQFTPESPKDAEGKQKTAKKKLEKLNVKAFLTLLSSPSALFTTLAYFSTYIFVVWISVWLPVYLVKVIKMSSVQMGYAVAGIGIVSVGVYIAISIISDRLFKKNQNWRVSRVYVVGFSMMAGALAMISTLVFQNAIWVIVAMCLAKGLTYAILPIGPTIVINLMPDRGSLMTSILTSSGNIAGIIGPMLTGFIIELAGDNTALGFNQSILFMGAIILLFAILFSIYVKPDIKTNPEAN
ncbi:MFS transporter [Peribacillus cavernae]|uniref:MFS transporter n=1 Tax=Peribacillus cavernae TaxID=1674310 RepID=A0A3S0VMJ8_9BACI|nr:MFS transporter [Peribacillus cavernae]MDQ0218851.1 MFS family permease [Peribacillus cavernae]RUQ31054.1 MFS transporter [Peribacillus cavernae]